MQLPLEFTQTIKNTFGEAGRGWLTSLPDLIEQASRRWQLLEIRPVSNLSYNFVAFAKRSNQDVVLKIGLPHRERTSEMSALRFFKGKGAVRLLEADEERGMFLLERLLPGKMLATLTDDAQATHAAAGVMLNLWRPAPCGGAFIQLSDWFKGFEKLRLRFEGSTGPLEKNLVERAEHSVASFFGEDYAPMLIHGDLHHDNILSSQDDWLAIDPKGVIGPAAYEVGPLLMNPLGYLTRPDAVRITRRRMDILSERLGFETERIREWGIAHAVLSAWWDLEDNMDWKYSMRCAEITARA
ncbi:MAG TPA: aminoglycoside phosphotransferase family protein [Anaerolineales bacterium]|nr:aminoglycoside phosphotransferase family protein [Anaerolineales bacterium]